MISGHDLFDAISRADDPVEFVSSLSKSDLTLLKDYADTLPDGGWPGVVRAQVKVDASRRFFPAEEPVTRGGGQ